MSRKSHPSSNTTLFDFEHSPTEGEGRLIRDFYRVSGAENQYGTRHDGKLDGKRTNGLNCAILRPKRRPSKAAYAYGRRRCGVAACKRPRIQQPGGSASFNSHRTVVSRPDEHC